MAVVGLISILAPLVNLTVKSLKDFQFGRPRLFTALAEVASLGTFLAVLRYRNNLHHFPSFWMLLVGFVIAVIVLVVLDTTHRKSPPKSSRATVLSITGIGVYVLAASLLSASFTQYGAKELIFRRAYGSVTDPQGKSLGQISVFCANDSATLETVTNSTGRYEFLLTKGETRVATELRVGQNRHLGDNYKIVAWDDSSFPFKIDFVWVP